MTNKHLGSERVEKIMSLLSQSEKVAVERGQALCRALVGFDRLSAKQKTIAITMLKHLRKVEVDHVDADGDDYVITFLKSA